MRLSHKRHESERLVSGAGHARVGRAPGAPPACEPTLAIPLEAAALSRVLAVRGPPLAAAASRRTDLTIMSRAPPCERRTRAGTGGREIPAKRPVQQVAGLPGAAARFRARGPVVDPRRGGAKDRQAGRCARLAAKVSSDLAPSPPVGGTDYSAPMGRPDRQPPARQADAFICFRPCRAAFVTGAASLQGSGVRGTSFGAGACSLRRGPAVSRWRLDRRPKERRAQCAGAIAQRRLR
jgi:hypothetical protein